MESQRIRLFNMIPIGFFDGAAVLSGLLSAF